jgi:hypothetical protein
MKIIEFRGHSDDTFGFDVLDPSGKNIGGDDHDDAANGTVRAYRIESPSTGTAVIVIGVYSKCPGATWAIGISPDDEDIAIPEWATSPAFKTDGYTPVMALKVPDDATVQLVGVDGKKPKKEADDE